MPDLRSELKQKVAEPVVLDAAVFDEICKAVCPHCAAAKVLRQRQDTVEWVHDMVDQRPGVTRVDHVICWATGFRNSRFAEAVNG